MKRRILFGVIGGVLLLFIGSSIVFSIGVHISRNYFAEIEIWNRPSIQVIGWIGTFSGGLVGTLIGITIGRRLSGKK